MKFGILLAAHIIPEWAEYYVDYELLKELIYHLCGKQKEPQGCCNFFQSKKHPDDVNEELHEEGEKISKQLRARLTSHASSMNLQVPLLGEVTNIDKSKIRMKDMPSEMGCVQETVEDEVMFKGTFGYSKETGWVDKTAIVSQWRAEISLEQQKVSRFYIYMLGLVNEEMEVLKELSIMYFGRTEFTDKGTSFEENIYYEKNGRPLDSPRNTRRRSVFSVKPLVKNISVGDEKTVGWTPINTSSSLSSQETEDNRLKKVGSWGNINGQAMLLTPLREQVQSHMKKKKILGPRTKSAFRPSDRALVRDAIYTIYQRIVSLQNFVKLNAVAFTKICKKFDKRAQCKTKGKLVQKSLWKKRSAEIADLERDIIKVYADTFEDGDIFKGKVQLSHTLTSSTKNSNRMFQIGLKVGIICALASWVVFSLLKNEGGSLPPHCLYVYRGIACMIYGFWLWGVDVYIWTKWSVNYSFVMEFNPKTRQPYFQIFDKAANLTLVYLINTLVYINQQNIVGSWNLAMSLPYSLLVYIFLQLFMPVEFCFGMLQSRKTLWDSLWNILIAPVGRVRFRDTFIADIMTSLVKVFCDLYMAMCLGITNEYLVEANHGCCHFSKPTALPIVICIPYYWRFMQSVNLFYYNNLEREHHFLNAVKYTLTMLVALLSALHKNLGKSEQGQQSQWDGLRILWILLTISSTIYTFLWDVIRDMALFQDRRGLRAELMYPVSWYYVAICLDLVLRFLWIFTLMPTKANPYYIKTNDVGFVAIVACAELTRRAMWALFRVENAQISKKSEFLDFLYVPMLFGTVKKLRSERKNFWDSNGFIQVVSMILIVGVLTIITVLTK